MAYDPIKTKRNLCNAKKILDKFFHFKSKWIIFSLQNQEVTFGESEKMLQKSQTGLGSSVSEFTQEKKTGELLNPGIIVWAMTGSDRSS